MIQKCRQEMLPAIVVGNRLPVKVCVIFETLSGFDTCDWIFSDLTYKYALWRLGQEEFEIHFSYEDILKMLKYRVSDVL